MSNPPRADAPGPDPEPRFCAPWEAQAFALVVALHKAGRFTWPEWTAALSVEIAQGERDGAGELGGSYYGCWLAALEKLVVAKSLAADAELRITRIECAANAQGHVHVAKRDPLRIA